METDKKSPVISIIMPAYNRAVYIGETIQSVIDQTFHNWELIIVDDGSQDDTEAVVKRFRDQRIQFIKAGRIGINGKIKNIGIKHSSAPLIAFIDSDDCWANTKLEKQVAALKEFPEAGFSLTGGYNFIVPGTPIDYFYKERNGLRYGDVFLSFFKSELSTTTPSLLLRRSCLDQTGGFDETKAFSDVDFILVLARNFKAVILLEPLLFRRLHASNDSGANWESGYEEGIRLIRSNKQFLPAGIGRDAYFRLYMNFGEDYLAKGERARAMKKFYKGWTYHPFSFVPLKKMLKTLASFFRK